MAPISLTLCHATAPRVQSASSGGQRGPRQTFRAPEHFFPILNRGEPAVLLCFICLYLSTVGAGPYGVDAVLSRRRASSLMRANRPSM